MTPKTKADNSNPQMPPPTLGLFVGALVVLAAVIFSYQFGPVVGLIVATAYILLYGAAYYLEL